MCCPSHGGNGSCSGGLVVVGSRSCAFPPKSALPGSQSAVPAKKLALQDSQSVAPATNSTKCCALQRFYLPRNQSSQSAAPATKSSLRGSQNAVHEICNSRRFTSRSPAHAFHRNAAFARDFPVLITSHLSKIHDSPHLACHEIAPETATMSHAAPAKKSVRRSKAALISCACHEKSTSDHQNTRLSWTTKSDNAHGTTTRAQSRKAPAPARDLNHYHKNPIV